MSRVIKVKRKRFVTEKLLDTILGKEPLEEDVELVTVEGEYQVEEPTEADIEHEAGKKKEEEEEDSEEDDLKDETA